MDEPTDLKFCREVKNQKIFDTCPGFLQNLDQGPDGALKTVFFKNRQNFGRDEPRDPNSFLRVKHQKIFDTCLTVFQSLAQGPDGALKTVFFFNMARTLEWNLET